VHPDRIDPSVTIETSEPEPQSDSSAAPAVSPRDAENGAHGTTTAQLRRFIKSRPYVPLHELRRRFELNGTADDVGLLRMPDGVAYVGLPPRECELLGELVRAGDVGLEFCHDPCVRVVVGVYPMRPVLRQ
jgi:hypothetical protein